MKPMTAMLRNKMIFATKKCKELNFGKFTFPMTQKQRLARDQLYDHLLELGKLNDDEEPDLDQLRILSHALATSLLKASLDVTRKISCPTDVYLCILALTPDGSWHPNANVLTKACSALQYAFRSILLHDARIVTCNKENTGLYFRPDVPHLENAEIFWDNPEEDENDDALDVAVLEEIVDTVSDNEAVIEESWNTETAVEEPVDLIDATMDSPSGIHDHEAIPEPIDEIGLLDGEKNLLQYGSF